jgi:hypothetical protein
VFSDEHQHYAGNESVDRVESGPLLPLEIGMFVKAREPENYIQHHEKSARNIKSGENFPHILLPVEPTGLFVGIGVSGIHDVCRRDHRGAFLPFRVIR